MSLTRLLEAPAVAKATPPACEAAALCPPKSRSSMLASRFGCNASMNSLYCTNHQMKCELVVCDHIFSL